MPTHDAVTSFENQDVARETVRATLEPVDAPSLEDGATLVRCPNCGTPTTLREYAASFVFVHAGSATCEPSALLLALHARIPRTIWFQVKEIARMSPVDDRYIVLTLRQPTPIEPWIAQPNGSPFVAVRRMSDGSMRALSVVS